LSKVFTPFSVQIYDKESNRNLQDLTILLLQYWLNEMCQNDTYLMTHSILIIENLIICPSLWELLKGSPIVARLLALSKSSAATGETRSKIIRIVTSLSKDSAPPKPPKEGPRGNKYENVNIRLYPERSENVKPYIPQPRKPMSRKMQAPQRMIEPYSHPEPRRQGRIASRGRESLRKVGYDAIHPGSRGGPVDYNQLEEQKGYPSEPQSMPYESPAPRPMKSQTEKLNRNMFDQSEVVDNEYQFPLDGGARRNPMVKLPFNDNLLHDYCLMLDKDNNRDINIFAIQSLEPLIKD